MPQLASMTIGTALDPVSVGASIENGADPGTNQDTDRISVDLLGGLDAAYRRSPVLLIESPHPGGVAG